MPKAYLQYLLFDDNFEPLVGNDCNCYTRVTSDANNAFEKLVLSVEIQEDGYLYTYVANESTENINVWFDDFTVTHLGLDVLQSTSYYPFGGLAENVQKEKYRFDYQGQFAEKDEETGFNHFELRDYDPKIGRTLTVDPARQFYSGYNWVGNNPVIGIDPTGGVCKTCPKTEEYQYYHDSKTNYGYDASLGGNGTFQRLEEVTITGQRPLITRNLPNWLTDKFNTGGIEIGGKIEFTMGAQSLKDRGAIGTTYNPGSVVLFSLNPKLKWVYGDDYLGFGGSGLGFDMAGLNGNTTLTMGTSTEYLYDVKSSRNYILNTSGDVILKQTTVGVGTSSTVTRAPLEAIYIHDHIHGRSEIKIGVQEDASGSFFGFGVKGAFNAQATLNQR